MSVRYHFVVSGARVSEHVSPVLRALDWRNIGDLVVHHDCAIVFRALNDPCAPEAIRSLFNRRAAVSQRSTRATCAGALELPAYRLSMSRRALSYRAATSWNRLPPATTGSRTRAEFLRLLNSCD